MKQFLGTLIVMIVFSGVAFGVPLSELKMTSTFVSNYGCKDTW